MDSAAFWFAVNEYTFNGARLAGAILYGVRKLDLLESGSSSRPQAVVFKNFTVQGIKMGFTVQPANCQLGTPYDMRNGGTQYAISSASFYRTNVSSVVTWAIVNTSLIALNFPGDLNPYIAGVSVIQTQGLNSPAHEFGRGLAQTLNGPDLDSKDERLQQVAFGAGYLWTNMQTAVSVVGAGPSSAVAWFRILPYFTPAGEYDPKLSMQGYAAIGGNNVINGAMAANALGDAVLSFSVVGSDYNFSSGYIFIQGVGGAEPVIEITRMGENPLFGFSKPVRNGDYTNAVVGPNNTFIVGAQFATSKVYTTSSGYRQNWGTFIAKVNPYAPAARPCPRHDLSIARLDCNNDHRPGIEPRQCRDATCGVESLFVYYLFVGPLFGCHPCDGSLSGCHLCVGTGTGQQHVVRASWFVQRLKRKSK
eukprot:jgi/Botrbrau1/2531/Bobra.0079s0019.1